MKELTYYEGVEGYYALVINKSQRTLTFVIVVDGVKTTYRTRPLTKQEISDIQRINGSKSALNYVKQIPHKEIRKVLCLW